MPLDPEIRQEIDAFADHVKRKTGDVEFIEMPPRAFRVILALALQFHANDPPPCSCVDLLLYALDINPLDCGHTPEQHPEVDMCAACYDIINMVVPEIQEHALKTLKKIVEAEG